MIESSTARRCSDHMDGSVDARSTQERSVASELPGTPDVIARDEPARFARPQRRLETVAPVGNQPHCCRKPLRFRSPLAVALALMLAAAPSLSAQGNSWNRIRYAGGTVVAKVDPYDWNTSLTASGDQIVMVFGHRVTLSLKPSQVTALSYGQEAHRRVADMVTLSVFFTPLALFGLLHESKNHFVGIEYQDKDGKPGAVLLEVHKDSYKAMLETLKAITGKPVRISP